MLFRQLNWQISKEYDYPANKLQAIFPCFTSFNAKQIKYWIGREPTATSKSPRVQTTEPMVSIKVFFHTVQQIEMKLKTYYYFNQMKRWLVFDTYRPTNISTFFQYFLFFSKYIENDLTDFDEI